MKWIKYKIVCNENKNILLDKKIGYSDANLIIAQAEAHNGEYTIEEDESPILPTAKMETEDWVFTLEDGSIVTKKVYIG